MIANALYVTARSLDWQKPDEDSGQLGIAEDADSYAVGIGGNYCVVGPRIVPIESIKTVKRENCISIDGLIHFKALLWWAHDGFSFSEYDSVEAAQLAAEVDWQTRFRELIASAPPPVDQRPPG